MTYSLMVTLRCVVVPSLFLLALRYSGIQAFPCRGKRGRFRYHCGGELELAGNGLLPMLARNSQDVKNAVGWVAFSVPPPPISL